MTLRAFAAGILAFGIGAIPSSDSWAAPGGHFAAAPAFAARGAPIAPSSPLMAHPRVNGGFHFRVDGMRGFRFSRSRDRFAPGFPFWWGYAAAGPYDYPADYVQPYGTPTVAYPPFEGFPRQPVTPHVPDCHTDSQTVASEGGGQRTINITRCY